MTSEAGVQFPRTGESRSTTATGRAAFAAAAEPVDGRLARRIRGVRDWRKEYLAPARDLVALAGRSPEVSLAGSRAGLAYLTGSFRYLHDGVDLPLAEACELPGSFATRSFVGGAPAPAPVAVPYRGRRLSGAELIAQTHDWVRAGVAEPSLVTAVTRAVNHPEWFDLRGTTIAMLGAGAELSPLRELLGWGAQVLAVDLPRPDLWRRVIASVPGTPGVLQVPVPETSRVSDADDVAEVAGADLLTQLPEVAGWIDGFAGDLVLGNYLYADGATNVRLSLASDALGQHLLHHRSGDTTLAYLATPTDAFQVDADVVADSRERWEHHLLARATRLPLRLANLFQPNYPETLRDDSGAIYAVADCLVPQQGPNYLLAKRMQRWRAATARTEGVRVSLNVAPATRTQSVVKNRMLAAAYAGSSRFGLEIFEPETCNALMALLLVRDLNDPRSAAEPSVPLAHPSMLFTDAATHGGLWRSPFSPRSVLGVAAVIGMIERAA